MRVLVTGSRDWTDKDQIAYWIDRVTKDQDNTIIHGGCRGADQIAHWIAKEDGHEVVVFYPDWGELGARAGPLRNQKMLDEGKPDLVLAFHENIGTSKGTMDMIRRANKAGVPVYLIGKKV